jgi:hypothetical protein
VLLITAVKAISEISRDARELSLSPASLRTAARELLADAAELETAGDPAQKTGDAARQFDAEFAAYAAGLIARK